MEKYNFKKKLIFTVCTGRCGTQLLTERLAELRDVTSLHEPDPNFLDVLPLAKVDLLAGVRFWKETKLPAIARTDHPIYVETSHLFCKGFLEGLLELGIVPDIILLSRPHREVALSLNRLGCIPSRTALGREWLLGPDDRGVLQIKKWEELNDYQLCYWYCLEIERRQQEVKEKIANLGGNVVHATLKQIRTAKGMMELIKSLKLKKPNFLTRVRWIITSSKKVNAKNWIVAKKNVNNLDKEEMEVHARIVTT